MSTRNTVRSGRCKVRSAQCKVRSGGVLVEFAFISLAFYLLFAGTIELGRMITTAQAVQNAARVGAREMALIALPPTYTFRQALADPAVKARIYDPNLLAIQGSVLPNTDSWPVLNRMLLPLYVVDRIGGNDSDGQDDGVDYIHYPGAVIIDGHGQLSVKVPKVRVSGGTETIHWLDVVEEVVPTPGEGSGDEGPFSLSSNGPERGLVALRINCPYQATTMVAFQESNGQPTNTPILAQNSVNADNEPGGALIGGPQDIGPYAGPHGLGRQYALALGQQTVRPFRRLVSAQSLFRREVYR